MSVLLHKSQLLYIGNDPLLNKASAAVLRSAGFRVRATGPAHASEALRDSRYNAVILCATLTKEETEAVVGTAKQLQAEAPIISMQVGMLGDGPHPLSSVVVDALQGPQAFIGAVRSVTALRQKVS